jgi:flagellar assembly factor FliW
MSDELTEKKEQLVVMSTRFGELRVAHDTVISIPAGLIGFPRQSTYIMIEHKPPFSWLQSVEEPSLAFVVIDGFEVGSNYDLTLPFSDKECDFKNDDEYAILLIVTVRPDPKMTTVNLKAPLFVNVRNRTGVQVIYDDPTLSTRQLLWAEDESPQGAQEKPVAGTTPSSPPPSSPPPPDENKE